MPAVHQLIAGAGIGDAITNYALEIQRIFRSTGMNSLLFAPDQHIAPDLKGVKVLGLSEALQNLKEEDILLYHYSIGSSASRVYKETSCKKLICYHNITPSKYFRNVSQSQALVLDQGREELKTLVPFTSVASAVSDFNRRELVEMGFSNTEVVPLVFPRTYLETKPDVNVLDKYSDGKTNLIFVGRVAPNKRFEDLIKAFNYYHKTEDAHSRLIMVGTYVGNEKYYTYLKCLVSDLQLSGHAVFTGHLKLADLIAYYQVGSAFLCLSEHEGFCLPLLEAMQFQLPVFALKRAAIPETMNRAGVLFDEPDFRVMAEVIHQVLQKPLLREAVLRRQNERLREYNRISLKEAFFSLFNRYLGTSFT